MNFIWKDPKAEDNSGLRVAAINIETGMIQHIFRNVMDAAKLLSTNNPNYYARQIGIALNNYHMDVLGFYWKRIK